MQGARVTLPAQVLYSPPLSSYVAHTWVVIHPSAEVEAEVIKPDSDLHTVTKLCFMAWDCVRPIL